MEWVETTGRTVDEAQEAALDQLGVDHQEAEFEVLEEPQTGLFGRLRREARVRARVRPTQPRPKQERRDRRRKGGNGRNDRSRDSKRSKDSPGASERSVPTDSDSPAEAATDTSAESNPSSTDTTSGRKSRQRTSNGSTKPSRGSSDRNRNASSQSKESTMTPVGVDEQAETVSSFLEGLLESFGLEGDVTTEVIDDDTREVRVAGDALGLLVGPRGQTLQAIGELARTVTQRTHPGPHEGRVRIDIAGYREKRRQALERFAQKIADEVREAGSRRALEPMNAADRKVVHDTINGIDGVKTLSEGEEPQRRVVVVPD